MKRSDRLPKTKKKTRRQSSLKAATTSSLLGELDRRREVLQHERDDLLAQLEEIDAHLADLEASPATPRKARQPKRKTSKKRARRGRPVLADVLQDVLGGREMSVTDATEAVLKSGYKTKSTPQNFRVMVNQTLTKDKRFKRVARGVYTAG
ncbi:MAG: hypothetical protein NCW75_04160 [Phycisphaera sp.]|nr:MAG: hypothetical protein NCW75_04160 [Phycisphaera sp.]